MSLRSFVYFFLMLMPIPLFGQQTGLNGVVMDHQGGVLPGASIHLEVAGGGQSLTTVTNAQGHYSFPSILAGDYVVRAESQGFAIQEKRVSVLVGNIIPVDFSLPVASTTNSVEVSTDPQLVSTTTSEIAGNIDPVQM